MRWIILRMIAAGSLSAFSAATQITGGVRPPAGLPAQPVRMPPSTAAPPQPLVLTQPGTSGGAPAAPPPGGRNLPRGSLLDLSV